MCHEWLWRRLYEEREPGRELWDEFERTRPLTDPEPADDDDAEITLERSDTAGAAEHEAGGRSRARGSRGPAGRSSHG